MKLRPGDQPLPIQNELPFVQDAVIADIEARKALGIERYGTPLQAFNGRDALRDAYEEAIDLCMYLKQSLIERGPLPPPTCTKCQRELHGYRGPLCRYCDGTAE